MDSRLSMIKIYDENVLLFYVSFFFVFISLHQKKRISSNSEKKDEKILTISTTFNFVTK